jgi:hypothetical protein
MMKVLVGELVIRDLLLSFESSPCDRTIFVEQVSSQPFTARAWRADGDRRFIRTGSLSVFELRREMEQRMCQNRPMRGTSKNARITRVPDVAAWFRSDCNEECVTANRQISKCRR